MLIEGAYLVRDASPLRDNAEVDREGRTVVDTFVERNADVAAGVRQQLEADARRIGACRLLPGRFMVIEQAMGVPKGRGSVAAETLGAFVEEMKASGFVAEALARHRIQGASVAPAA